MYIRCGVPSKAPTAMGSLVQLVLIYLFCVKIRIKRKRNSIICTFVESCMTMFKQHADFSQSQLMFSCMFVSETLLKEKNSAVYQGWTVTDITSIPRSPNPLDGCIKRCDGQYWRPSRADPSAVRDRNISSAKRLDVSQARETDVC